MLEKESKKERTFLHYGPSFESKRLKEKELRDAFILKAREHLSSLAEAEGKVINWQERCSETGGVYEKEIPRMAKNER